MAILTLWAILKSAVASEWVQYSKLWDKAQGFDALGGCFVVDLRRQGCRHAITPSPHHSITPSHSCLSTPVL